MPKKTCSKCHETKTLPEFYHRAASRDGLTARCKTCTDIDVAAYQIANPAKCHKRQQDYYARRAESLRANSRAYRAQNRIACALRDKIYAKEHRDSIRERYRNWTHANAERLKAKQHERYAAMSTEDRARTRRWGKEHPVAMRISRNRWKENNKEKVRLYCRIRRAHMRTQSGKFTQDEWENLCKQYDYKCVRCGYEKPLTIDHVIPVSLGGSSDISNIQPLCGSCNSKKWKCHIDYRRHDAPQL